MAYFPFFMDMEEMRGLVVGGGRVALRKIKLLLNYNPTLHIVAPEISCEIREITKKSEDSGQILISCRPFQPEDLEEVDFVVAATGDTQVNAKISHICKKRKIPVNVVDVKEECSFIFPSLVQEGAISVGISTGGNSPWIAKFLKDKVQEAIPEGFGEISQELGRWRDFVKEKVSAQEQREKIFTTMAETIIEKEKSQRFFTEAEIDGIIAQACLDGCSDISRT